VSGTDNGDRSSSPDLARQLGEAARKRAKDYDWEMLAERVLEVYRDLTVAYERRHVSGH
jgi:glycosyltransferase involved in cell wall biosynthesis